VQGAVRLVDVRARTLEVTTGVGMALWVVHLQVPLDTRVTASGAPLPLARLQAGDLVRVSYGARPGGYVAYSIERLERVP
jgi:cell envelope opacity-associated protein A